MAGLGATLQSADWKTEKHVPVISCPDSVKADVVFTIEVSVGKEVPHPNSTEHHIRWIQVYFKPEDDKFNYHLGTFEFTAHGEAVAGANQGPAYTEPIVRFDTKIKKSGTIFALSYCNIHGLWENSVDVKAE